jgi:hypothetical protein
MVMKKAGLCFAFFLGVILAINLVSAQFLYDLKYKTQDAIRIITDFLSPFLEFILGVSSFDQYFWVRVLLLALIFVIVLTVLGYMTIFKENTATRVIVSLVVSIFSAKYIGESDIITGILLPYGVLGVALTFILPFLIFFFFVHKAIEAPAGRRAAWVFFAVVFFGLWLGRADQLGSVSWIYFVGVIAVILSIIFDPKIHEYFGIAEMRAARRLYFHNEIARLRTKQEELRKWIIEPSLGPYKKSYEKQIEDIEKRIEYISRKEAK